MTQPNDEHALDWAVRVFVYNYILEHERPPSVAETATGLNIALERAQTAYEWLNQKHALFLEPGSSTIRIANPFSGIPTDFRVQVNSHSYWANCAWDSLGVLAALHSDGQIEAKCTDTQEAVTLRVEGGQVHGQGEIVHFPLPFQHWYDDLILT